MAAATGWPGGWVSGGDPDRPRREAVEPHNAPGCERRSCGHPADVHVVRRSGKTPRDGKEERHEKRDGQNCEHSPPTRSGSIHLLHLLRGNHASWYLTADRNQNSRRERSLADGGSHEWVRPALNRSLVVPNHQG